MTVLLLPDSSSLYLISLPTSKAVQYCTYMEQYTFSVQGALFEIFSTKFMHSSRSFQICFIIAFCCILTVLVHPDSSGASCDSSCVSWVFCCAWQLYLISLPTSKALHYIIQYCTLHIWNSILFQSKVPFSRYSAPKSLHSSGPCSFGASQQFCCILMVLVHTDSSTASWQVCCFLTVLVHPDSSVAFW